MNIGDNHPEFGEVVAIGTQQGEPFVMFSKDGVISNIPKDVLDHIMDGTIPAIKESNNDQ